MKTILAYIGGFVIICLIVFFGLTWYGYTTKNDPSSKFFQAGMSAEEPTATNDTVNTLKTENLILPSGITGSKKKTTANTKVRTEKDGPEIVYEDLSEPAGGSLAYFRSLPANYQSLIEERIRSAGVSAWEVKKALGKAAFTAGGEPQYWSIELMSQKFGGKIAVSRKKDIAEMVVETPMGTTMSKKVRGEDLTYNKKERKLVEVPASVVKQANGGVIKGFTKEVFFVNGKKVEGERLEVATPGPGTDISKLTDAQLENFCKFEPGFCLVLEDRKKLRQTKKPKLK